MAEIKVNITWNKERRQWDMEFAKTEEFLQEFFNCKNFRNFFENPSKTGTHTYILTAKKCT